MFHDIGLSLENESRSSEHLTLWDHRIGAASACSLVPCYILKTRTQVLYGPTKGFLPKLPPSGTPIVSKFDQAFRPKVVFVARVSVISCLII